MHAQRDKSQHKKVQHHDDKESMATSLEKSCPPILSSFQPKETRNHQSQFAFIVKPQSL